MAGAVGRPSQLDDAAALQGTIQNGLSKIGIVEHPSPSFRRLVRREDHRPALQVALVDDLEEYVGGIGRMDEVADLVDDQDMRMEVAGEGFPEAALPAGQPPLGFIHEDAGSAFCLDIADLHRTSVTIPVAFEAVNLHVRQPGVALDRHVRRFLAKRFRGGHLISTMIDEIKELLNADDHRGDA